MIAYGTAIVDIPWHYRKGVGRAAGHYPRLTDDEVLRLPVGELLARRSHLFLWVVDCKVLVAADCLRAWGFEPVSMIVWVKVSRAQALRIGPGNYLRKAHEVCWFATRGQAYTVAPHLRPPSVLFFAPRAGHSEKPPHVHRYAERLSPAPRVELFARSYRPGWAPWPSPGLDARDFLVRRADVCTRRVA